jgi:transketolase
VLDLTAFGPKIEAFGWHVQTINGNDMGEVVKALEAARKITDRPTCIVSQTKKGFGILPVLQKEGDLNYHGKPLPKKVAEEALALLS